MKLKLILPMVVLFTCSLTGCYRIRYIVDDSVQDRTYSESTWNHFFFFGLAPVTSSRDMETLCPGSKVIEVRTYNSPANVLSTILSLGMSSGRSLEYTCVYPQGLLERSAGKLGTKVLSEFNILRGKKD